MNYNIIKNSVFFALVFVSLNASGQEKYKNKQIKKAIIALSSDLEAIGDKTIVKKLIDKRKTDPSKINEFIAKENNSFLLYRINNNLSFLDDNLKSSNKKFKCKITKLVKKLNAS